MPDVLLSDNEDEEFLNSLPVARSVSQTPRYPALVRPFVRQTVPSTTDSAAGERGNCLPKTERRQTIRKFPSGKALKG